VECTISDYPVNRRYSRYGAHGVMHRAIALQDTLRKLTLNEMKSKGASWVTVKALFSHPGPILLSGVCMGLGKSRMGLQKIGISLDPLNTSYMVTSRMLCLGIMGNDGPYLHLSSCRDRGHGRDAEAGAEDEL
jgi:hypothetical protein